jgi:hypothetical protein
LGLKGCFWLIFKRVYFTAKNRNRKLNVSFSSFCRSQLTTFSHYLDLLLFTQLGNSFLLPACPVIEAQSIECEHHQGKKKATVQRKIPGSHIAALFAPVSNRPTAPGTVPSGLTPAQQMQMRTIVKLCRVEFASLTI